MKKTLSYKSKRNIVIASIIAVLLVGISTAGYFYIKNNDKEAKAFTQNGTVNEEQSVNEENTISNAENEISSNNQENNNQNQESSNQNQQGPNNTNQNNQTSQGTNQTTNNNETPNQTTGELPEQEFITEEIEEQEVLVSEDFMVEWVPAKIQANVTTENLAIIRPNLQQIKKADKTVVEKNGIITYTILVANSGKIDGKAIIKDNIQEDTVFIEKSIEINGQKTEYTLENLQNGINVTVPTESVVKLSFKVKAITQLKTGEKIENIAYVNDTPTNKVVIDMPNIQVEKTVFMKNYEEIPEDQLDTVTFDKDDIAGYKIVVTNTGTIKLNNVTLKDVLENEQKVFLDTSKPEDTTNTVVDYDEALSLEPGEYKEYIVYYKVIENDVKNISKKDSLKNNVTATGYYTNDNNEEKSVEDEDDAKIKFTAKPDISIVKTQKVGNEVLDKNGYVDKKLKELKPGDIVDYTITIKNEGNTKLTGVVVTDIMSNNPTGGTKNVTINTVKVEGKTRNYTVNNGSLNIDGALNVGETLVITASYKVVESDMSDDKIETIKNTATVVTNETGPKDSSVEAKTLIYKPIITISKTGKLADGITDANEKTLKYGDTVTYILTAKNTGTKYDTVTIKDEDIKTLVNAGNVQITSNVAVAHFNTDGSTKTETITENKIKALAEDGIKVYVPAGKSATVTFTVKVTAAPGTTIQNTVGNDTVTNYVKKEVTAVSSSQKDKNIVIVLDLSNSMLFEPGKYEHNSGFATKYDGTAEERIQVLNELNNSTNTKLYAAKQAIKAFTNSVLTNNPNNQITLITFNFASKTEADNNTSALYGDKLTTYSAAEKYIGTQVLVPATSNAKTINDEVDAIKLTHPLLTNVVAAMNLTKTTVQELAKDKTRDVEVIFLGDGRPSFNHENCAKNGGFYTNSENENDTNSTLYHVKQAATAIKATGAHIYTVAYELPSSESDYANKVFETMSSGASYRLSASSSTLNSQLAAIGNAIATPPTTLNKVTKNDGSVEFTIANGVLNIGTGTPVTLTITPEGGTAQKYTFTEKDKIGNGLNTAIKKIIEYNESTKTFTIYANNIDASATISLRYYYSTSN